MTTIEKTVYVANDGKEFLRKMECTEYEKQISEEKERNEYLSAELTKLINDPEFNKPAWKGADIWEFKVEVSKGGMRILQRAESEDEWEEPDEDFMYEYDQYQKFKREAKMRFFYIVNTPSYYWGK